MERNPGAEPVTTLCLLKVHVTRQELKDKSGHPYEFRESAVTKEQFHILGC